jgi:hypothetical protein
MRRYRAGRLEFVPLICFTKPHQISYLGLINGHIGSRVNLSAGQPKTFSDLALEAAATGQQPDNEIWSFDQSRSRSDPVQSGLEQYRVPSRADSLSSQAKRNAEGLVFLQLPQSGYPNSFLPLVSDSFKVRWIHNNSRLAPEIHWFIG